MIKFTKQSVCLLICIALTLCLFDPTALLFTAKAVDDTDTPLDSNDVIKNFFDLPGEAPPDSDTYTTQLEGATYKVTSADQSGYVNLHKNSNPESSVIMKIPDKTYHIVTRFENNYGYITYKGQSGYIRIAETVVVNNPIGQPLVQMVNDTIDALESYSHLTQYKVELYNELFEQYNLLDSLCTAQDKDENIISAYNKLNAVCADVEAVVQFIENPTGEHKSKFRLYGDVNADGMVSMLDITLLQRYIANMVEFTTADKNASEVTDDNEINMVDVVCLQKYKAQLFGLLPVGLLFQLI